MFKNFFHFLARLKYKIVFSVSSFIKTDEHHELLNKIDSHFLIWNHQLINLDSGMTTDLNDLSPESIASAAKLLTAKNVRNNLSMHAALYLPDREFIATEYELPEVAPQDIASALSYQINELMPAYPGQLLLAVNHINARKINIALWLDKQRTEQLFAAFKNNDIELTCIIPRVALAFLSKHSSNIKNHTQQLRVHDENGVLHVELENQSVVNWSTISHIDMKDQGYFQQWEQSTGEGEDALQIDDLNFWQEIDRSQIKKLRYTFFPDPARQNLKQRSRLKKGRLAVIAAALIAIALISPFIINARNQEKWDEQYQSYMEQTAEIRNMRNTVNTFADKWALFNEYPRANVISLLTKLNKIIPQDSWINSFEIIGGEVSIEGYSPNPIDILEVISQQPEFSQAAFNQRTLTERGKVNEHFGVTFQLNKIDLNAYQEKYFPDN